MALKETESRFSRHCEERSDEANPYLLRGAMDCFASLVMTVERQ
jgi:hypothetical protein